MRDVKSPSPVVTYFVRELEPSLPASETAKLGAYADEIVKTTNQEDLRRAWHCAEWAIQLAERASSSHLGQLVEELKEVRKLEKDTIFGTEFGMIKNTDGPGEAVEIQWVDNTVAVAKAEGERAGWESVPWEDLLKQLLAVAPPEA